MTTAVVGTNPDAVLELLRARRKRSSRGGDGRKLALIVEGGGMRGALSAGSLLAVDVMGYRDAFDEVYACSAGAVNAAYFLSGQGALGITVYFDSISNRRFYNPLRVRKIVDVEYVYDYIVPHVKTLDERAIRAGGAGLFLSVTDADTGANVLLDVKEIAEPIPLMLKASSALPVLYNRTVRIAGREYVDGGLTCSLPILQAAARGCTDVLVLLTRTSGYQVSAPTRANKAILYALLGRKYPALMRTYSRLPERMNRDRNLATGVSEVPGLNVATICPTAAELIVGRTTIDRRRLVAGAHSMAKRTTLAFRETSDELERLFEAFRRGPGVPSSVAAGDSQNG